MSSGSITSDVAGQYRVTIAAGGFVRTVYWYNFPASGNAAPLLQKVAPMNPNSASVSRLHLRGLVNGPSFNFAPLEASPATLVGVDGGLSGPAWSNYGNA